MTASLVASDEQRKPEFVAITGVCLPCRAYPSRKREGLVGCAPDVGIGVREPPLSIHRNLGDLSDEIGAPERF
jgi:hypothetical protein